MFDNVRLRASQAVAAVASRRQVASAYLFGSHIDGEPDQHSDIDIGIFVPDLDAWDVMEEIRFTGNIQKELGSDLDIHFFDAAQLPNPEPASFAAWVLKPGLPVKVNAE